MKWKTLLKKYNVYIKKVVEKDVLKEYLENIF